MRKRNNYIRDGDEYYILKPCERCGVEMKCADEKRRFCYKCRKNKNHRVLLK